MTQPFTTEDLFLHQKVQELDAAPDGAAVACTVRSVDREQDQYIACLWQIACDGSRPPRRLPPAPGLAQPPRWPPKGDPLPFASSRGGLPCVDLLPRDGGEARPVGDLP